MRKIILATIVGTKTPGVSSAATHIGQGYIHFNLGICHTAGGPSRLATLYTESSDSFVASAAASIATGWSEPVPGRELHPQKSSAFHGALLRQLTMASE